MSDADAADGSGGLWRRVAYVGIGILFVSVVVAGVAGDGGPRDRLDVRSTIVGGQEFGELSETGRETLEPLVSGERPTVAVPVEEFERTLPELLRYDELRDSEVYHVVYEGQVYLLEVETVAQTPTAAAATASATDAGATTATNKSRTATAMTTAAEAVGAASTSTAASTGTAGATAQSGGANGTSTSSATPSPTATPTESAERVALLSVTDNTETVLLEYRRLSSSDRRLIRNAESTAGAINVSAMPPFSQASGVCETSITGSQALYYLSWDGEYYTVVTYEPVEFVDAPSSGQILGWMGVVVGFVVFLAGAVKYARS